MKNLYIIPVFIFVLFSSASAQKKIFQGTYMEHYGKSSDDPYRLIEIHYVDSNHILFYMEIGRGAPSYNSGAIYGRLQSNPKNSHLEFLPADTIEHCQLDLSKKGKNILIKTIVGACPFGNGVLADGNYLFKTSANPVYFVNRKGEKVYFSKTSPEEYLE